MVAKSTPISLTGSTRAQLSGKSPAAGRVGYVSDDDNSLLLGNGTTAPWEYPTKTKIATMISAALSNVSGGAALSTTAPAALAATAAVGTGTTAARADHVHALPATATTSASGLMSATDKSKLDGVTASANNYTHPSTHPAPAAPSEDPVESVVPYVPVVLPVVGGIIMFLLAMIAVTMA